MLNIFITNLGKYTEGTLQGEWVNLPATETELEAVYERIGINEEYEEMFITDYETDIDGLSVGEYDSISDLNELAETWESMEEYEREIVEAMISEGYDLEEALEKKDNCMIYYDCYDMEDVAREYVEETGLLHNVPEILQNYFDFEAYGRDMSYEGHFVFTNSGNCVQIY